LPRLLLSTAINRMMIGMVYLHSDYSGTLGSPIYKIFQLVSAGFLAVLIPQDIELLKISKGKS
jgi:hypothetical protein